MSALKQPSSKERVTAHPVVKLVARGGETMKKIKLSVNDVLMYVGIIAIIGYLNGILTIHIDKIQVSELINTAVTGYFSTKYGLQNKIANKIGGASRPS